MAIATSEIACRYCYMNLDLKVPENCTLSNGSRCPPCARQLKLKAQIEETKKLLDELIDEERQTRKEINLYHDSFLRLPAEIHSHIFRFTLPDFDLQGRTVNRDETHSEPGVLILGAVCQRWRKIAWSTPRLWSNIMLDLSQGPTNNMIEVIQEWLKRSRMLPLSIRLILYNKSQGWDLQTLRFISLFNEHSARWQNLSIRCEDELFKHFEGSPDGASSRLKTLQLITLSDGRARGEPRFKLNSTTPQLERIIAIGFPFLEDIKVSWNYATSVTFEGLKISDIIRLLRISPKLINLRLPCICEANVGNHFARIHPAHPHLRTLYLSTSSTLAITSILDTVTFPSLEELDIHGLSPREADFNGTIPALPFYSIKHFLQRSSCSLTSFSLERIKCKEQEILDVLYSLPPSVKILHLDIRLDRLNPQESDTDLNVPLLFNHLCRSPSATGGISSRLDLLPNMERFKYHVSRRTEIPWDLLPGIARPVSGEKRPFKELTIIERPFDDESDYDGRVDLFITRYEDGEISRSAMWDLLAFQDDGIDLCFPNKLSRELLFEILKDDDNDEDDDEDDDEDESDSDDD